uniref:Carotenoid cleavage dioxygenase 4 n=1 Tax=Kalanchoe fedtschenkoi TaxID=63787 RepID=A0A7N0TYR4_KALFE
MDSSMSSSGQALLLIRNPVRSPLILASGNLRNISPKKVEVGSQRKLATSIPAPPSSTNSTVPQPIKIDGTVETRRMLLMANVFRSVDELIHKYLDLPLRPSIDPEHVLSGNFAPVHELAPTECEVIRGSIPTWLDGAYIRNGPNPQFHPAGPYHLFEGDGMLHLIRISGGKAKLCSRYVQTHKYLAERAAGSPVIPNFYSSFNGIPAAAMRVILASARALACHYNPANGIGMANTGVARIGHGLYALGESDLPYAIRVTGDGDVETVGRFDFNGALSQSMTAHPKLDADTGEVFAFQYNALHPFLTYFRIDPDGTKTHEVPISSLTRPSFFHDFAVTKKYAIFCDSQLGINSFKKIIQGGPLVGADLSKVPRLGVLPRYAADDSEMRWFDVPGFNMVHSVNAWDEEEANEIVLVAPNAQSIGHALERLDLVNPSIEKVRINLKTGNISRNTISPSNLEFSAINPSYLGKKNTYAYAAIGDPLPKIKGMVKLDVTGDEEAVVGRRMYGEGCFGGEPCFVARDPCDPDAKEDDGCLVTYLHDESTGESRFLVMDAKSANLEVLAELKLPQRVPYGFHGLFIRGSDLGQPQKN